ncbi:MAG: aminoglycoside phosphotransferase family protein [Deltaproteobacteria bacterium]|nr:aminoglycoside phosphotransferase family protein [Deltaproteobacteria bacterium]
MVLPRFATVAEFESGPRTLEVYGPALREICRRQGLPYQQPRLFTEASAVVAAVDERFVIKLFFPADVDHAAAERAVLAFLDGVEEVPAPRLLGHGVLEGWSYVVMELQPGQPLSELWDELGFEAQRAMMGQVAQLARGLHDAEPAGLELPWPTWERFVEQQVEGCLLHHEATGLAAEWCRQIPDFVAQLELNQRPEAGGCLLHTELMPAHVLVRPAEGGWAISGLIDFEPAMVGHREYEWGAVAIFFARGRPGLLGELLRGYGYAPGELDARLQAQMLGYLLLHRYSRLPWYLDIMPPPSGSRLSDVAASWFCF